MRVVIAGSSGLIGTALVPRLREAGHEVVRLVRRTPQAPDERGWDPAAGHLAPGALEGADAVVNLCGAGIGDKRWTGARKQELRDSRMIPTDVLARAVVEHGVPTLVNGSAVGWYGDTGAMAVDETARRGTGFLADLCRDWEAATKPAVDGGVRVVLVRTGLVLSPSGGLMGRIKPLFQFGLIVAGALLFSLELARLLRRPWLAALAVPLVLSHAGVHDAARWIMSEAVYLALILVGLGLQFRHARLGGVASLAGVALELTGVDDVVGLTRTVFHRGLPVIGADGGALVVRDAGEGTEEVVRLIVSDQLDELVPPSYAVLPLSHPLPGVHAARTGEREREEGVDPDHRGQVGEAEGEVAPQAHVALVVRGVAERGEVRVLGFKPGRSTSALIDALRRDDR